MITRLSIISRLAAAFAIAATAVGASASVIKIDVGAFQPSAGLITFSELPLGTTNPVYTAANYGGDPTTAPTVSFGGYFTGQSLGNTCGGLASGCVVGSPTGPLSLSGAQTTRIVGDSANPTSPVLSGTPTFNGPVAVLFDRDLAGVGLDGGFFDAIGGTAITAFARDGTMLGQVSNEEIGIEFLGLVTNDGSEKIAGLLFSLIGAEPAGFAIDNLRFGLAGQVVVPGQVPEPLSAALVAIGLLGLASRRRFLR